MTPEIEAGITLILTLSVWLIASIWAYGDAERRGKSGCLVALVFFLSGPLGLILWLVFRPEERY